MEDSRDYMLGLVQQEKVLSFAKIFDVCENRLHAIFLFLSMLELVQQKYMHIMIGEGMNNFIIEFNESRTEEDEFSFPQGSEGLPAEEDGSGLPGETDRTGDGDKGYNDHPEDD
jgi:segregation and condensation protein A